MGRGGYHGCATWPTKSRQQCTRKALRKVCKTRALVRDSTYIERGLAPPITICHARTPDRRVARANERDARAASRQQPRQRSGGLRGQTERLSAHAGSTQIVGSSQQSGGVRWPPVVAGTQAEVRSGEGKGGGSPACAGRCASLWAVWWKEGAVAAVRRAWHRASWAAAMGTLLGTRRSRGWRMGGAAAGETGAAPGRLGAERRCRLCSRPSEPEEAGLWRARSSGRCAPFTSALAAGASSTSPCRRAGQRDHRPRQAPR